MIADSCDVIVIGGGPGGSTTATYLAQKGYDVVLFDKQVHPRYAVGESLIPLFWKYMDAVGVTDKILAEGFLQKMGGTVRWKGEVRTHTFKAFGYDRPAYHIERDRFDHILLEHAKEAGVKVFEGVSVTGVNFGNPDQPVVGYRGREFPAGNISCRFVVDASGQNAVLGRQLGIRKVDQDFKYMSVWGYFKDSKYIAFGGQAHPAEDVFKVHPTTFVTSLEAFGDVGWGWHIILREETSVGFVLPVDQLKLHRTKEEDWESYFLRMCHETYGFRQLLQEAEFVKGSVRLIRDYSYQSERVTGPGYFLVGDAAGFIDPIFSVGVVLALYGAYLAAWAIDKCFKSPDRREAIQKIFSSQMHTRIELSRNLALPSYQSEVAAQDMVKEAVSWEGGASLDLMATVSRLTSRSDNFNRMMQSVEERKLEPEMYIELEDLVF